MVHSSASNESQAAIEGLITDFNDYQRLPAVLRNFARKYRAAGKYDQAQDIYETIAAGFPDTNDALRAQLDASMINILTFIDDGNDTAAMAAIDKLIVDYNDHPYLANAVFVAGEEYYNKATKAGADPNSKAEAKDYYRKAKGVWERMITESADPNAEVTVDAYYFTGVCFRRMGEYGDAIFYYQEVVDNWPDYKYAWSAQCLIGECYEKLKRQGSLPEAEADPLIEQAYKLVIENYPECSLAGHACLKLAEMNLKKGRELEAAGYYELFLTSAPADPRVKSVKARLEELGGQSK